MKLEKIGVICLLVLTLCGCRELEEVNEGLLMTGTDTDNLVKFAIDEQDSYIVSVTSTSCVANDVKVNLDINSFLVKSYNTQMSTNYSMLPEGSYSIDTKEVVISAGASVSSSATVMIDKTKLQEGVQYVIPVTITSVDGGLEVIESSRTIYLKISRTIQFAAPYVGDARFAKYFEFEEPVTDIRQYTWEVKFMAENFNTSQGEPIKIGGINNNMLRFGEAGNPGNVLEVYAGTENKLIAKTKFAINTWYMLSIVNDGKTMILYVNGEKDNSMTITPYEIQFNGVEIGQSLNGYQSKQLFHGHLGGMRFWSRALSKREIRTNLCGVDSNAKGLEACYRMDEGEGNVFYDSTAGKRHLAYPDGIDFKWTEVNNKCVE